MNEFQVTVVMKAIEALIMTRGYVSVFTLTHLVGASDNSDVDYIIKQYQKNRQGTILKDYRRETWVKTNWTHPVYLDSDPYVYIAALETVSNYALPTRNKMKVGDWTKAEFKPTRVSDAVPVDRVIAILTPSDLGLSDKPLRTLGSWEPDFNEWHRLDGTEIKTVLAWCDLPETPTLGMF